MREPKLIARTGDTLSAIARLSGSENHKGFDILHADGYAVAYVIPIDEDGAAGGKLARQFASSPELLEALEDYVAADTIAIGHGYGVGGEVRDKALAAIAKAKGEEAEP